LLAGQGISHLLWNVKVYYYIVIIPPVDPTLSHLSVHTFVPYVIKIHFNFIPPSTPQFLKWSFFFRFSIKNFVCIFHLLRCATCPIHLQKRCYEKFSTFLSHELRVVHDLMCQSIKGFQGSKGCFLVVHC